MPIIEMHDKLMNSSQQIYSCERIISLKQIIQILKQQPCVQIIEKSSHLLMKRDINAGSTVDVHALQTTINDHRTMINYLVNNSINATFVADAINNHHSKTGPILTSWRDLIDLLTISLLLIGLTYYCICGTGFGPCDKILSFCCRSAITRIQDQHQQQPMENEKHDRIKKHHGPAAHASVASIEEDIVRFNNAFLAE